MEASGRQDIRVYPETAIQLPNTVAKAGGEVRVVKTCASCGKQRGFWGRLFGGWMKCENCEDGYCGRCFAQLMLGTGSTAEWTEGRDCKDRKAPIPIRLPIDYHGWP